MALAGVVELDLRAFLAADVVGLAVYAIVFGIVILLAALRFRQSNRRGRVGRPA